MPGVVVTTAVRTGPTVPNLQPSSTFFIVGEAERGPTDRALLVTSLEEFEDFYGGFVSYGHLHPQVQAFFEEGGARCYVSRVVGASPSASSGDIEVGTKTLNTAGGSPAITLTAVGAGDWSENLEVSVTALGSGFAIKLFLNDDQVYSTGECNNAERAVNRINASVIAARYITASLPGAGSLVPAVAASSAFSAGDDNRGAITVDNYTEALTLFTENLGAGAVAAPDIVNDGFNMAEVHEALITHAKDNNRVALCSFPLSYSADDAIGSMSDYAELDGSQNAAFFWPYVSANRAPNTPITMSPEGYVAAKRSVAFNARGPWAPYAGLLSEASYVTGLTTSVGKTVGNQLDDARVNALRFINGRVRVYGARSASSDEDNFRYITAQETLNYIITESENRLEDLVFTAIDGRGVLFGQIEARLRALLDPIRQAGGLYEAFDALGERIDYGYTVVVNDAINPAYQLAQGVVRAKVGVRISSVGDQIVVNVTKSNLTASVT